MKTRIFTLLAVMIFASISAFAQSIEHIKGDVNGDGRVNVADIASIIDIIAKGEAGYFYFGNVRPTAENYTSLPGVIGSYTSISEASGATATIAAGETLYMMCPASWMEGKSVELEDENGNPISFLEEKDAITISGYVIYRTQALNDEKTVVLKTPKPEHGDGPKVPDTPQVDEGTYYWYAGLIKPNASNIRNLATGSSNSIEHWEGKEFNVTNNYSIPYTIYVCTPVDFEVTWKDTNGFTINLIEVDGARFTFNGVEYKVQKRGRDLAAGATLTVRGYNEVGE